MNEEVDSTLAEDDQQLQMLLGSKGTGRLRGHPNFRNQEDLQLAQAYVKCTTDAATGTDQSSVSFWEKIRVAFTLRGGSPMRSSASLQNRFNKVLQAEVNKYIGIQHSVLREYKSGWQMADYDHEGKRKFFMKFCKSFKHDGVLAILKDKLPKYNIDRSSIDSQVNRALFFIDGDNASDGRNAGDAGNGGIITPRPSYGKKKAKEMRSEQSIKRQKCVDDKALARKVVMDNREKVTSERSDSIGRIAAAAEAKNNMVHEQLMFQLFMQDPDSDESRTLFTLMRRKYIAKLEAHTAAITDVVVPTEEGLEDPDQSVGFNTVSALGRYNVPPAVPNVITLVNCDDTADNNDGVSIVSGPLISSTQRLLSAPQDNIRICDVNMDVHVSDVSSALMK
jgi:hypothetical protein